MVVQALVLASMLLCAILAIQAQRLLVSALWLAGCSALLALALAILGAPEVGVIELSVGAGLVTVIFVFAISIAGDESTSYTSLVPRSFARVLMLLFLCLLVFLALPRAFSPVLPAGPMSVVRAVWEIRALDTLLQVAMIFCGVLGSLGLLAEPRVAVSAARKGAQ
ncbi:MAG TPA: hydrogenase subunit MbhD domain-containing protein [Spirochaetia bacterium]|nr:hydrogenase subunit MbhD domain-containing protein [Spirochaetia bacterium]